MVGEAMQPFLVQPIAGCISDVPHARETGGSEPAWGAK